MAKLYRSKGFAGVGETLSRFSSAGIECDESYVIVTGDMIKDMDAWTRSANFDSGRAELYRKVKTEDKEIALAMLEDGTGCKREVCIRLYDEIMGMSQREFLLKPLRTYAVGKCSWDNVTVTFRCGNGLAVRKKEDGFDYAPGSKFRDKINLGEFGRITTVKRGYGFGEESPIEGVDESLNESQKQDFLVGSVSSLLVYDSESLFEKKRFEAMKLEQMDVTAIIFKNDGEYWSVLMDSKAAYSTYAMLMFFNANNMTHFERIASVSDDLGYMVKVYKVL